jgi:hypothetical protein
MKTHLLLTFFFVSTALSAQIIYVDQDATGQNDGSSWTNAYTDLNEALDVAQYGDSVWVAEGTYFPADDDNRHQHFTLRNGVKLIGGFMGTETEKEQRDWETYLTILDGDIGVPGDSTDNSYSVLHILPCDSTTWLDGFVVQHGQADSNFIGDSLDSLGFENGGGIYLRKDFTGSIKSMPNIQNCWVRNNYAETRGGGLGTAYGNNLALSPYLSSIQFEENQTGQDGGGLCIYGPIDIRDAILEDLIFENNQCGVNETQSDGSAIVFFISFNDTSEVNVNFKMRGCRFQGNDSGLGKSGVVSLENKPFYSKHPMFIQGCEFIDNTAPEASGTALNFFFQPNRPVDLIMIEDCLFARNFGDRQTIRLPDGFRKAVVRNCAFIENEAIDDGAALYSMGNLEIQNCFFYQNEAMGASLDLYTLAPDDSITVSNCTFLENKANKHFLIMGISNLDQVGGPMIIQNSIFRSNEDYKPFELGGSYIRAFNGAQPLIDNCLIDVPICSTFVDSNLVCGPGLIFEEAVFIDSAGGDFRLDPCSPGLNAGIEGYWTANLPDMDLLEQSRRLEGVLDMGAFETPPPTVRIDSMEGLDCPEDTLGNIALAVDYACGPYTLKWPDGLVTDTLFYSNLTTGIYSITVTDNLGRTDTVDLEVSAPSELMAEALITDSNQSGPGTGSILITSIIGGTPPYSGQWIGGPSGDLYTDLPPGTYDYVVTDSLGCTAEFTFEVGAINSVADWGAVGRLQVFPNPFAHTLEVRLPAQADRYSVHDMQGRLMEVGDIQPGQQQLQLGAAWSPGLYVVQVVSGAGEIWRGRVVKGE